MADVPIDPIGAARRLDNILGRADLPYTYTEPNGDSLRMCSYGPDLVVTVRQDGGARTVVVPREETPNLARAVLAAAGDTGHEVISIEDYARAWSALIESAARSMRERAAGCAEDDPTADYDIRRQILALPLIPDDTEGVRTMRHCVLCASGDHQPSAHDDKVRPVSAYRDPDMWETTPDGERIADRDPDPGFARGWAAGIAHAKAKPAATVHAATPEGEEATPRDEYEPRTEVEAHAGGDLEQLIAAWEDDQAQRRARVRELEDDYNEATAQLAQERTLTQHLQALADRRARDRYRDERNTARAEKAQVLRAAREVPALAELRELVERLALDLSETTKAVTQRLATVEDRLDITDDTDEGPPARYRDRDGDVWEQAVTGHLFLSTRGMTGRPYAVVADEYGPLTPVTTEAPADGILPSVRELRRMHEEEKANTAEPAPCEVCGRAPDEQEHGPNGQCRHTPATRLGRPTT